MIGRIGNLPNWCQAPNPRFDCLLKFSKSEIIILLVI